MGKVPSETPFDQLVDADLDGVATEAQLDILETDPGLWKDELVAKLQAIDREMAEAKASSMRSGTRQVRGRYEAWKAERLRRKNAIVKRIQDVKVMLRNANQEEYGGRMETMEHLRLELQAIRKLVAVIVERLPAPQSGEPQP